jgi:hypothetical protein
VSTRFALPPPSRRAFDQLASDLRRVLDARLVALVASGLHSSVAFVTTIEASDLEAFGSLTTTWHHAGLDTPLLLTPTEFRRSLDTFPLEYEAILERHEVIVGTPPFADLVVDVGHVRRACEVLAKSHLIHLRQGWIDAGGKDDALGALLVRSAEPLRALLSNVARLHQSADSDPALAGARLAGLDVELIGEVLALEATPERSHHLVRRMTDYLEASRKLWAFVDAWKS